MEQKRVSFKVAKAIKKSGYPQDDLSVWYDDYGVIFTIRPKDGIDYYVAPTYLEAWLWLWREKNVKIVAEPRTSTYVYIKAPFYGLPLELNQSFDDPEEAIIAAIEHLCNNDLIE